jgi:hypothetical protein
MFTSWTDMDDDPDELKYAVEFHHGGKATLVQTVPVKEIFWGRDSWEGVIYVFDLAGNLLADRAYAWSSPIEGGARRGVFAILHTGTITCPSEAVRQALVVEHQEKA